MAHDSEEAPSQASPGVADVSLAGPLPVAESGHGRATSPPGPGPGLEVLVTRGRGFGRVVVRGEVDVATAPRLAKVLDDLVVAVLAALVEGRRDLPAATGRPAGGSTTGGAGRGAERVAVVVDVREVPVLCAAGFDVLAAAHARLAEYGCGLRVTGARPLAVRCLHILELQHLLT